MDRPLLPGNMTPVSPHKFLWRAGAIFVGSGMIAGAFGAHALTKWPGMTAETLHAWQTATNYAIYNGLGLLMVSMHPRYAGHRFAGPAIVYGGAIFSGTILTMVLLGRDSSLKFLGPVTPLAGMVMIAGYLSLAW